MLLTAILALAAMALIMAAGWAFQRAQANGGWTDVVWTFGTGATAVTLVLWPGEPSVRQLVIAALVGAWSLRLGGHIALRVVGAPEDARYAAFRQEWGADFQRRMFSFLQAQGLAGAVLVFAIVAAARNPAPFGQPTDHAALAVAILALCGESLADAQLQRFRSNPKNHGRVADRGLWAWSRHPNYFFEWLLWMALPLFAVGEGHVAGWWALLAPVQMYYLLNHVSGVPPLERAMLQSRGAAYEAYAARTSRFFLMPPRRQGASMNAPKPHLDPPTPPLAGGGPGVQP